MERERREISLASIAEVTKVPLRHLIALEMEHFHELPGGILTRGILRGYCRQVGLDEDEWLGRMPENQREETAPALAQFAENVSRSRHPARAGIGLRWWGVLAMLLALGALCWSTWRYVVQPAVAPLPLVDAQTVSQAATQAATEPDEISNPHGFHATRPRLWLQSIYG